ncbi:MAG TPA: biotin/lipoyl-containing protein [Miltoncostaeaceae bacterium]|nr:biotin/lipoyl-containing protein [Miltoncostaeaceae bacterium]
MSGVGYVDTTLRDLATFPWGSGIDADDIATATASLARVGALALEAVDPRVARAVLEFRTESPWDRVRAVVRHAGRTPVGVVVHGRLLWSDHPVAEEVLRSFVVCAAENGVRRIRALDPLNGADHLAPIAAACAEAGVDFVPSLVVGPAPAVGDARWREEARALGALPGAVAVCVSDGAGHLSPAQLAELVDTVTRASERDVELLVQAPGGLAPLLARAGIEAGASAVYAAAGPAALAAARPSAETLRAALVGGSRELRCDQAALYDAARAIGPLITADRLSQAAAAVFGPAVPIPPDLEAGLVSRLGRLGMSGRLVAVSDEARRIAADLGGLTFAYPLGDALVAQAADHVIEERRFDDLEPVLAAAVAGHFGPLRGPVAPEAQEVASEVAVGEAPAPVELGLATALSDEDLVLRAQFPEAVERLVARRRSLRTEVNEEEGAVIDRALLDALIQAVEGSDEAEVEVEVGGARVTVRRAAPVAAPIAGGGSGAAAAPADAGLSRVESPMVGTFYRAPSPDADPFVEVGVRVEEGQPLCLIEAMKLFNEITAPVAGVVREIACNNADPVEFGQVLFLIDPS